MRKTSVSQAIATAMPAAPSAPVSSVANLREARAIKGNAGNVPSKTQKEGQKAIGSELASKVWHYITGDTISLREFCRSIFNLDNAGRDQFRRDLNAHKKQAKDHADAIAAGKKDSRMMTGAQIRSAFVRVSELMTVSKAADKGATAQGAVEWASKNLGGVTQWEAMTFANVLQYCRTIAVGTGAGRKPASPEEKAKRYILSQFKVADLKTIAKVATELAARIKTAKQMDDELKAMTPKKPAKVATKKAGEQAA